MESIILKTIYSSKLIIIFFLISCGQVVMDDDKLEEKSIVEAGGGINVISILPSSGTSFNLGGASQTYTINFSSPIQNCNSISPFTTSSNSEKTGCSNQALQFYRNTDNSICAQWESGTSPICNTFQQIKVTIRSSTFSLAGKYTLKIPSNTIYSSDYSSFVKEFTAQFEIY